MTFELICEVEPATKPDLTKVRHQIGVLSTVADRFLIPDNHIGRATVSSIAVAHEVALMGGTAVACLNARDRNVLGFRRDLLTAQAYGVDEFLFVFGDRPETGRRSDDLTVATMIDLARAGGAGKIGVSTRLTAVPAWKREADAIYTQVTFSLDDLLRWRDSVDVTGAVYAGVMVIASAAMGARLSASIPQLAVPADVIDRIDGDRSVGVELACDLTMAVKASGAFDGVHLIPVSRYRDVAASLEPLLR